MKEYDCDLHFHGPYSGGVSKNMLIPVIAEQARLKGLEVVCTSDALHGKWMGHLREELREEENGIYRFQNRETSFIVSTEVESDSRVHHLIYFPSMEAADEMKENMKGRAIFDSWGCGRPRVRLSPERIVEEAEKVGAIAGPAHAFTPYFSVYAHFDSMGECYGGMREKVLFMELGLSADSDYADMIRDNHNYNFLTSSDAHSPWPHRMGREFTRMRMKEPGFKGLEKALKAGGVTLNAGLDPKEGKYHRTACNSCYVRYSMEQAQMLGWSCPKCKGQIKKGVRERILELADCEQGKHPDFRPPYMHILPLAEIIQLSVGVKNVNSLKVQNFWKEFVQEFGSEIEVLIDAKAEELEKIDGGIAKNIESFRKGYVVYSPGGGGNYGKPFIAHSKEALAKKEREIEEQSKGSKDLSGQKSLGEY